MSKRREEMRDESRVGRKKKTLKIYRISDYNIIKKISTRQIK
jgi:hypothetical protein